MLCGKYLHLLSENFKKGMSLRFVLNSISKFCMSLKNFPPLLYSSRSICISNSLRPHGPCSIPGSLVHRDSPGKNTGVGCHLDLPNPGIESKSPASRADSLPPEPSGKPKNTGMSGLSLLQGNFPTQEWNRGLLYCRWILYQLSYAGSSI